MEYQPRWDDHPAVIQLCRICGADATVQFRTQRIRWHAWCDRHVPRTIDEPLGHLKPHFIPVNSRPS